MYAQAHWQYTSEQLTSVILRGQVGSTCSSLESCIDLCLRQAYKRGDVECETVGNFHAVVGEVDCII